MAHRYFNLFREFPQLLFELKVFLRGNRLRDLADDAVVFHVLKYVPVEYCDIFAQPYIPEKVAGFLVAHAGDILDEPIPGPGRAGKVTDKIPDYGFAVPEKLLPGPDE